jgi:predicted HAD superfamily Cof-like phosphohydrolase
VENLLREVGIAMNTIQRLVTEFHEAFGQPVQTTPQESLAADRELLREDLIREELHELTRAMISSDGVEVADALGDLLYVVYGTAVEYGIDLEPVVAEIHRSNMTKLDADGEVLRRSDGKVLKGDNYEPPDLKAVLDRQRA